ncbi:DNA cytosine methyltransferase [Robbsia sp. Bb-Pol-6]|uniref:DNA (cytosine-5-)-methyltransferase n=1 Tax=Robbsia betulipollinis TaxID=2981849 RepID=A0ABT3ZSQ7_9BURK|nr:DNA cytosine methyltransferase [Robbsia betulipollinis]MCY0389591.1 DNA cytosine methyltransferase [Robbsia betulipollinis]
MKRDFFSMPLDLGSELIIDNFAGGGGASTGLERAFGRPVDIAINHDAEAIAMHTVNHPHTAHYCESVFDVNPVEITGNQPAALVWLSPDCKHFSKAKGGKPVSKKIRGLAWIALRWAATVKPRVVMLENVEEFVTWGPLGADGKPDPAQRGRTFRSFVNALRRQGYVVEHRELRACDFGAPTIRKRFFLVARRDHLPIVWPVPTHGNPKSEAVKAGKLLPWRTAAECIDWSIPCPSIFERKRELKPATLRRIAKGIMKFVVDAADPFVVPTADGGVAPAIMHITHQGDDRTRAAGVPLATITTANRGEQALISAHITKMRTGSVGSDLGEPVHTVTAGGEQARPGTGNAMGLVSATLIQTGYGERPGQAPRAPGLDKPLGTAVAGGVKHALVSAFLAKHYGGVVGTGVEVPTGTVTTSDHHSLVTAQLVGCGGRAGQSRPRDAAEPLATVTSKADTAIAVSHLLKLRNNQFGQDARDPASTLTAGGGHLGEVRAFLMKYYGEGGQHQDCHDPMHTIPTRDRLALVTIQGEDYAIVDIGMRMLTPRELARAQGFPDSYVLDPVINGKPLSKSAQVRMIGNSVCPDVATALITANFAHEKQITATAA